MSSSEGLLYETGKLCLSGNVRVHSHISTSYQDSYDSFEA